MRSLATVLVVAALTAAGADGFGQYQRFPTTSTTVRPEEACHFPCTCQRLSRWTPRMRAHCVVHWDSDKSPNNLFQLDSSVDEVDFSRSWFRKLYASHLVGLERVKVIHMNEVGLVSITTNAFDRLTDLWSVSLERNHLTSLSPLVFVANRRLHYLSLRSNALTVRPGEPVVAASSLQVLDLTDCLIGAVYVDTFRALRNLRQLRLEGNNIKALPPEAVASMPQLSGLFLQRNELSLFPSDAIQKLPQLLQLHLDGNKEMVGPLGPVLAPKLQRLSAADCALEYVQPNLLATAPALRYLDVQHNQLRELWLANESAEAHLVLLDASNNPLVCDCALLDALTWAEDHVEQSLVTCGDPPTPWMDAQLHKLNCSKTSGTATAASDAATGASEAGAAVLWVCVSLVLVLALVGTTLLVVYRHEVLARYFSPQARAAASGGGDVLPLERNHTEDVHIGLPEGGVAPWQQQ